MTETHPRLEIRNLKRAYGGRAVVDDVSLKIMPGQVTWDRRDAESPRHCG